MGYESGRLQVDNALMAGSILFNDVEGFKSSLKGFIDVIDTMRTDGSLPYQTARGNAAIWYQNLAINVLIAAAEMAKYQGIDLYSFKSKNGTDIHDAITFLLNSIENNEIIYEYASRNINPWQKGDGIVDPMDYTSAATKTHSCLHTSPASQDAQSRPPRGQRSKIKW